MQRHPEDQMIVKVKRLKTALDRFHANGDRYKAGAKAIFAMMASALGFAAALAALLEVIAPTETKKTEPVTDSPA